MDRTFLLFYLEYFTFGVTHRDILTWFKTTKCDAIYDDYCHCYSFKPSKKRLRLLCLPKKWKGQKFYLRTKRYPNTISPDRIAEIQIFEWGCSKLRTIHFNLKPIHHCCSSWTLIIFILSISMPDPSHYILVCNNFKVVSFSFDWWTCNISVVFEPILMMTQTCQ